MAQKKKQNQKQNQKQMLMQMEKLKGKNKFFCKRAGTAMRPAHPL